MVLQSLQYSNTTYQDCSEQSMFSLPDCAEDIGSAVQPLKDSTIQTACFTWWELAAAAFKNHIHTWSIHGENIRMKGKAMQKQCKKYWKALEAFRRDLKEVKRYSW